ncbi:MAG: regulatory protein RecX [Nonlabens sp.]
MLQRLKSYTLEEAKRAAERYCAYQERCHKDVQEKLRSMGMIPLAIDEILGHLIQHKFLDESRFARLYAGGKFRIKKWGRNRIKLELKQRGLNERLIKLGLKEIPDQDYLKVFDELAHKRNNQLATETDKYKRRKKLADYLIYRGWESHLVFEKTQELVP